jgi:antitoxin CcdA
METNMRVTNGTIAKKPVNLSINADLLREARAREINLSATLEQALTEAVAERRRQQWLAENQTAIANYNARVDADGVFSDGLRSF